MPAQYHAAEVVWVFRVWLETVSALSERNCEAMYVCQCIAVGLMRGVTVVVGALHHRQTFHTTVMVARNECHCQHYQY